MKKFNITGVCIPEQHYMANVSDKIERIVTEYVEQGEYFTINRARQYGKTTTLRLIRKRLEPQYQVISMSFEAADDLFTSKYHFAAGFVRRAVRSLGCDMPEISREFPFEDLDDWITQVCDVAQRKIVLIIDEVDKSSDNQIFLSFLGLLRNKYLQKKDSTGNTFHSVILAGVYDIKNMKLRMRSEEEHKYNSPWNVAADFDVDMSLSASEIASMLAEYETEHGYGIDAEDLGREIYEYTGGYPYLVSYLCLLLDTKVWMEERFQGADETASRRNAWSTEGVSRAVKLLLSANGTLFDDMFKKITDYQELRRILESMLLDGVEYPFNYDNQTIQLGVTFGILRNAEGKTAVSNRIFETRIYNWLISESMTGNSLLAAGGEEKSRFVVNGHLDVTQIIERFAAHFHHMYGDKPNDFLENECRFLFLTFIKPIINGTGNYYIEAQTRNQRRMDIVIDYLGVQYIIELKVWRGEAYEESGRQQLADYLDGMEADCGWLVSFCFRQSKKQQGLVRSVINGKKIVEVVI